MMRFMDTPVPIPNTKVKRKAAESTAGEALWEGKWLPGSDLNTKKLLKYEKFFLCKFIMLNYK